MDFFYYSPLFLEGCQGRETGDGSLSPFFRPEQLTVGEEKETENRPLSPSHLFHDHERLRTDCQNTVRSAAVPDFKQHLAAGHLSGQRYIQLTAGRVHRAEKFAASVDEGPSGFAAHDTERCICLQIFLTMAQREDRAHCVQKRRRIRFLCRDGRRVPGRDYRKIEVTGTAGEKSEV